MSFQLIPFENVKNLPAKPGMGNLGNLLAHVSSSYTVISLKGKKFTKVSGGEKTVIMNPKDPDSPATAIGVVVLNVSKVKPRVFYLKAYNAEDAEGRKPDCMSSDGVKPDANASNPQAKSCAACPHNVWGTKKRQDGSMGKGKACDETIRMAVAEPGRMNDPMLLRVPPGSLGAVAELGKFLHGRGFSNTWDILVKVSFDPDADAQKLQFTPVAALPDELKVQAAEAAALEVTDKIVNGDGAQYDHEETPALPAPQAEEGSAEPASKRASMKKTADAAIAKAAAAAAATPAKEVTTDEILDVVAAATPAKKAAPAKPAAAELDLGDMEIDGLDGVGFDD